jgi:hypothetical protein
MLGALLLASVSAQSDIRNAVAQEDSLPRLFAIESSDTGAKEIPLKGIRQNGEITKVSNYKIDFNNVIQIGQGQNLVLLADSSAQGFIITKAKLVNEQKQTINLVPASGQQNTFSLNAIPNGVYTLQVVGRLGNIEGGYETVLVVPIVTEETRKVVQDRINQILLVDIYVEIIFEDPDSPLPAECLYYPDLDQCKPPENGKCPAGYAMNEGGHCYPSSKECPAGFWRADDDESGACVPKESPKPQPGLCIDVFPPPPGCGGPSQGLVPIAEDPQQCEDRATADPDICDECEQDPARCEDIPPVEDEEAAAGEDEERADEPVNDNGGNEGEDNNGDDNSGGGDETSQEGSDEGAE